ncbi:sensor histidine kinase, partial [Symbiobacterium thermophilum]|uniref:sensor histidine kinase n=1 Tax=Symbiobacterium thermophilum TaxID=2734 RepID=UPI0023532BEF
MAELAAAFNRMRDRLEADERSRRQLVADIAHELRHPLAVMQGHVDLLQDGRVELTPEALLPIQDEIIRLNRLVGDLRDLSLAEVGRLSLHLTTVSPEAVLRSLMADLGEVAAAKGVNLEWAVSPGLPHLVADPDRLRQILINLLTNALRYTPPGGRVLVEAEARAGEFRVSVIDSGPGIDPADLPH